MLFYEMCICCVNFCWIYMVLEGVSFNRYSCKGYCDNGDFQKFSWFNKYLREVLQESYSKNSGRQVLFSWNLEFVFFKFVCMSELCKGFQKILMFSLLFQNL